MELWQELANTEREIAEAVSNITPLQTEWANAEREYRVAKAKKTLIERSNGVPVTLIADIVKGDEEISILCLKRDVAQGRYEQNREFINTKKKHFDLLKMQYSIEMGNYNG